MHYNESTDYMNKEARIPKPESTFMLNSAAYAINASMLLTMALYFYAKDKILAQPDTSGIDIKASQKNYSSLTDD
mgnify:CR=1 FL=1|jgi:hypothetical protein